MIDNAKHAGRDAAGEGLQDHDGGTDNHLMLVDLRDKKITGKAAEQSLGRAHITCNKNGVPFDEASPMVTSGIRLGSPAATSRGFGTDEFTKVGELIAICLDGLAKQRRGGQQGGRGKGQDAEVAELTGRFPIY